MTVCTNDTRVTYNGITILDVLTEEVDISVRYDSQNVDPVGLAFTISVQGYIHTTSPGLTTLGISTAGQPLATRLTYLQGLLTAPRRTFAMYVGGQVYLHCEPGATENCNPGLAGTNPATVDIENGPRTAMRIIAILGEHAVKVQFKISYVIPICYNGNQFSGLLNLRFWLADDIDCSNWMTTRTYTGRLRVRHRKIDPRIMGRAFAIPPLSKGFRRQRINLLEDPNGLELAFTVVDQEIWAAAPAPATWWSGEFNVSAAYDASACESECRVSLRGHRNTPKWDLLRLGMRILDSKLRISNPPADMNRVILLVSFEEKLEDNEITAVARIKYTPPANSDNLLVYVFAANHDTWFKPLDSTTLALPYDHKQTWAPGPSSESLGGMWLCALQTPCCPIWLNSSTPYTPPPPPQPYPDNSNDDYGAPTTNYDIGTLGTWQAPYKDEHRRRFYWQTRMSSDIKTATGVAGFAKAQADASGVTQSLVRMHAPAQHRYVRMTFTRNSEWPDLPKPKEEFTDSNGVKHTLVHWEYLTAAPNTQTNTSEDQREVSVYLVYALGKPIVPGTDKLPVGCLPYRTKGSLTFQQIDTQYFKDPEYFLDAEVAP
mgnify:CR=1 FL=1